MKKVIVKKSGKKGKGLFAGKDFKEGEIILRSDIRKLKKRTLTEVSKLPRKIQEHADYVGNGKYVIDMSPSSYINHSCEPNIAWRLKAIGKAEAYALRDIKKGEELNVDYSLTAVDQFDDKGFWKMKCRCGSKKCRKIIIGDFFKLPRTIQRKYWKNLPPSIKKKCRSKLRKLR